jgi:hypothetical protein
VEPPATDTPHEFERFDAVLVDELRLACERAHELAHPEKGLPRREVPALDRTPRGLQAVTREEVSWRLVRLWVHGDWPRLTEVARRLADDPDVEADTGWTFDTSHRPVALWDDVIGPMFEHYGRREPDLEWKADLAREIVTDWRGSRRSDHVIRRTIAPVHNLRSLLPDVRIGSDTVIRPMTDGDRDEIWRHFGALGVPGLTAAQVEGWTHVIEDRWAMTLKPPLSVEPALDRITNVVTALRLHHPGVTGATMLWTTLDPPDAFVPGQAGEPALLTAEALPTLADPLQTDVGPADGPALTTLVERVTAARADRRLALALRRFDSAYERRTPEDALIDLWVAFEALLLPDVDGELSQRAALRIGRLVGQTASQRQEAFKLAKKSYTARSRVVHGKEPKVDLDKMVRDTRQLARAVIREWALKPPPGDVFGLDEAMLA